MERGLSWRHATRGWRIGISKCFCLFLYGISKCFRQFSHGISKSSYSKVGEFLPLLITQKDTDRVRLGAPLLLHFGHAVVDSETENPQIP